MSAVPLLRVLVNRDGYVEQFGRAALAEIPQTAIILALAVMAIAASIAAMTGRPRSIWIAWVANAPTVALLVYLAFWFTIF
jgi:hypothetical protein